MHHIGQFLKCKDVARIKGCTVRYAENLLGVVAKANKLVRVGDNGLPMLINGKVTYSQRRVTLDMYCDYYGITKEAALEAYARSWLVGDKKPTETKEQS